MKISEHAPFLKHPTLFYQPLPIYGKNLKPPFFENFKNSNPSPLSDVTCLF